MTFSLIARDPHSGRLGIVVASHYFGLATLVPWVEPGVGVVATQRRSDPSHGPLALRLLRDGLAAPEVLERILSADPRASERQIAVVDAQGGAAAHTGPASVAEAGHAVGTAASAQGNFLAGAAWTSMLAAYEADTDADFADRLMRALTAGERAGGDARGQLAATMIIVAGLDEPDRHRPYVDLRVERSGTAVEDLAELVDLQRAYRLVLEDDPERPLLERIAESRQRRPHEPALAFRRGVQLARLGERRAACDELAVAVIADRRWMDALQRLAAAGGVDGLVLADVERRVAS
jgi:uncharacterized Ntn-hydrolase superfamily protein